MPMTEPLEMDIPNTVSFPEIVRCESFSEFYLAYYGFCFKSLWPLLQN